MALQIEGSSVRKERPVGGSPDSKKGKFDNDDLELSPAEAMPAWAVAMQSALMAHTTAQVAGLKAEVDEAKAMAMEVQEGVRYLNKQFREMQAQKEEQSSSSMRSVQQLEENFRKLRASSNAHSSAGSVRQSRTPQPQEHDEKRMRTVTFGNFPFDSKAEDIKGFIDKVLGEGHADVEETFAFGKKRAERGGARFSTAEGMWKYMTSNAGKHQHDYKGTTVYCNVDGPVEMGAASREKAVRKAVRVIIESNGGNGDLIKKDIDTNYKRGIVWWKDERVAEWNGDHMQLLGAAAGYLETFQAMLQ